MLVAARVKHWCAGVNLASTSSVRLCNIAREREAAVLDEVDSVCRCRLRGGRAAVGRAVSALVRTATVWTKCLTWLTALLHGHDALLRRPPPPSRPRPAMGGSA